MRNALQLCLAANNIQHMRKGNRAFLGDRMIKQLLNSVIAKYRDLLVSRRSIIRLSRSARHRQITIFFSTSSNNC